MELVHIIFNHIRPWPRAYSFDLILHVEEASSYSLCAQEEEPGWISN